MYAKADVSNQSHHHQFLKNKVMKANAPEKIWIDPANDLPKLSGHIDKNSVEYIRKDTFIEKACSWLKENADSYTWYNEFEGESGMIDEFIDDFKKYMEGE